MLVPAGDLRLACAENWPRGFGAMSVDADLSASVTPGSSTLTFASVPTWVKVGHFYIVDQLDDPTFVSANTGREGSDCYRMRTGNGPRGLGQLIKVVSKTATTVTAASFGLSLRARAKRPGAGPPEARETQIRI